MDLTSPKRFGADLSARHQIVSTANRYLFFESDSDEFLSLNDWCCNFNMDYKKFVNWCHEVVRGERPLPRLPSKFTEASLVKFLRELYGEEDYDWYFRGRRSIGNG